MDDQRWLIEYRKDKKAIWILCRLTNGEEFYITTIDEWIIIKEHCEIHALFIEELCLQFRSHRVTIDIEEAEGIYLSKSIKGYSGGFLHHYYTVGILKDGIVHKKCWLIPELVVDMESKDPLNKCFGATFIYDPKNPKTSAYRKETV